ncbi:hypothetical protein HK104_004724 [Borealophlyctis nickersoniae]|nr:hypothetical protein HK104_004724 [Borealophlyctis nickersoniae]
MFIPPPLRTLLAKQGIPNESVLGKSLFELLHPSDKELVKRDFREFMDLRTLQGSIVRCRIRNFLASPPPGPTPARDSSPPAASDVGSGDTEKEGDDTTTKQQEDGEQVTKPTAAAASVPASVEEPEHVLADIGLNAVDEEFRPTGCTTDFKGEVERWGTSETTELNDELFGTLRDVKENDSKPEPVLDAMESEGPAEGCRSRVVHIFDSSDLSLLFAYPKDRMSDLVRGDVDPLLRVPDVYAKLLPDEDYHRLKDELLGSKSRGRKEGLLGGRRLSVSKRDEKTHNCTGGLFYLQHRIRRHDPKLGNSSPAIHPRDAYANVESVVVPYGAITFICMQALTPAAMSVHHALIREQMRYIPTIGPMGRGRPTAYQQLSSPWGYPEAAEPGNRESAPPLPAMPGALPPTPSDTGPLPPPPPSMFAMGAHQAPHSDRLESAYGSSVYDDYHLNKRRRLGEGESEGQRGSPRSSSDAASTRAPASPSAATRHDDAGHQQTPPPGSTADPPWYTASIYDAYESRPGQPPSAYGEALTTSSGHPSPPNAVQTGTRYASRPLSPRSYMAGHPPELYRQGPHKPPYPYPMRPDIAAMYYASHRPLPPLGWEMHPNAAQGHPRPPDMHHYYHTPHPEYDYYRRMFPHEGPYPYHPYAHHYPAPQPRELDVPSPGEQQQPSQQQPPQQAHQQQVPQPHPPRQVSRKEPKPRECESCHTTESPEWRRGPSGQKTLCNACGLRYSRSLAKRRGTGGRGAGSRPVTYSPGDHATISDIEMVSAAPPAEGNGGTSRGESEGDSDGFFAEHESKLIVTTPAEHGDDGDDDARTSAAAWVAVDEQ